MQLTHGLRRSSTLFGERIATICDERETRWSELADRVARIAGGLIAKGAKPGDRIAILALNSDRYIEAYFAAAWAGCVAVPFNTRWAPAEIAFAMQDSTPSILIVDKAFSSAGERYAADGVPVLSMDAHEGVPGFDALAAANEPVGDRCGSGEALAAIFYTGGTTGRSKGVMLSHANLIVNFLCFQSVVRYDPSTVFLHTPPMFHLADASCLFGLSMLGATHVCLPEFEPGAVVDTIGRYGVDALVLVPTMIGMLCEAVRTRPADLSGVKRLVYGASSISESLLLRAMKVFPNARFYQAYGQTELSPVATVLTHEDHLGGRLRSAGGPVPQVDLRIVDADMREVATGEVGEVAVRGPGVMLGYWNQPDVTAQTRIGDWLRTGDAGRVDEAGYLYLVDRVKDMIVSGGENVYSAEVENALLKHADVLQCAVIGIPHPKWGEAVHAVLYMREGSTATAEELTEHCGPLIANYKQPKSFDLRDAPLPVSGVGKILKTELRKPYWEGAERGIS